MFQENTSHLEFTVLKEFLKNTSGVAAGVEGESADSLSSRDNSLPHTTTHCTMLRHTATRCNIETTRLLPSQQRKCQRPWVYFRDKKPSEPRTTSVRDFKCQRYGCQSLQISETPNVRDYECQGPAFLAKIWQTMGTPAMNAEASQSRRRPAPRFFFLEGASVSESDFAWILSGVLIILYLPKMTLLKDTCLTYEELLSQLDERLGGPQKFQQNSDFIH